MATLKQIGVSGFAGTAPVPFERYAIQNYLTPNELFNLMQFVNIGMGTGTGNFMASILQYNTPDDADFRDIGDEYDVSNNPPTTVNVTLKPLGGEFQTDRAVERAFSNNPAALSNWTEQQIGQKLNAAIRAWIKYFIQGNSTTNTKQFDGLLKYFGANADQVAGALDLAGGLTNDNAIKVETYLNESIAKLANGATAVITTKTKGKPFLQTLEQYRNRGINAITVNDRQYQSFMGLPIVGLEDSCFNAAELAKGIPVYFVYIAEQGGIRVAVPVNPGDGGGYVVDIVRPQVGGTGVFVKNGGVEILSAPIVLDYKCASACYINVTEPADSEDKQ